MRSRRHTEDEPFEINLIPMIDCMLILLIFFMVATTVKHSEKELPIELPQADASINKQVDENLLVVALDRAGQKYVRAQPVTTEMLHQTLREAGEANPNQRVRLDADRQTKYEDIVEVIELCQFHGLRNVGLHTRSESKK
ncbi:MAG: biopolymer transport protein ExbD [Chthoniobacter sp.]|jgi:biopolymer transport protein ExbD|nr:biopolymer transport protein ExbD [Chthoniobacter sp.]